ncbi:hypothetical protein [Thauera sp. SDU_THAU2]|uniref:hypothetical protein n=1 Tax=Thauera sp. SDU_THAU2 TaxID=3136633 RepID=UPI00311E1F4E
MKFKVALASATILAASMFSAASAADMTVGFSQIGSNYGAAETTLTKQQAEQRGIDLKFADAQQKQENQIKALRSFIAQGVDAILRARRRDRLGRGAPGSQGCRDPGRAARPHGRRLG